ncbi:hypothetical protein [Neolewinella agarilytica]|uniref:hypothetical protein n=1 Tax=Neolewinella agarilytica TaxID=478744 RepID=UPI002355D67D|nr:hypothetical protein [Neolewinella agarilytica]
MPNPYDDILSNDEPEKTPQREETPPPAAATPQYEPVDLNDPRFQDDGQEALDEVLGSVAVFNEKALTFSRLLSELRVVDHEVKGKLTRLFLEVDDPHQRGTLSGEKQYHELQLTKFRTIIQPMRELADLHLATVKQFNRDIDEHYYSVEKTDQVIAAEKKRAVDGINLQRKILAEATNSLQILKKGLEDTERRIRGYVNVGGKNNISDAELQLLIRQREEATSGRQHGFDYVFFDVNLLDKTAISLGIYLKETSAQYMKKLGEAMRG